MKLLVVTESQSSQHPFIGHMEQFLRQDSTFEISFWNLLDMDLYAELELNYNGVVLVYIPPTTAIFAKNMADILTYDGYHKVTFEPELSGEIYKKGKTMS